VRTDPDGGSAASWLQLSDVDSLARIVLHPLTIGGLHTVVFSGLGRSYPRPTMARIQEVSVEIVSNASSWRERWMMARRASMRRYRARLPSSAGQVGGLDREVLEVLLAAACAGRATVGLLARAVNADAGQVAELLEDAEDKGIVGIDGNRVRFTHRCWQGRLHDAAPPRRRAMHRRLAEVIADPNRRQAPGLAATSVTRHVWRPSMRPRRWRASESGRRGPSWSSWRWALA